MDSECHYIPMKDDDPYRDQTCFKSITLPSHESEYDQRRKSRASQKLSMDADPRNADNQEVDHLKQSLKQTDSKQIFMNVGSELQYGNNRSEQVVTLDDFFSSAGNCQKEYLNYEENTFPYFDLDEEGIAFIEQPLYVFKDDKNPNQEWTMRLENKQLVLFYVGDPSTKIYIAWSNILGASHKRVKQKKGKFVNKFFIHMMKIEEKSCCIARNRNHTTLEFKIESETRAHRLVTLIQNYSRCENYLQLITPELKSHKMPILKHKLLIFANPVGGDGTALEKWESVSELFQVAGYQILLVETKYQDHARQYVNELPKNELLEYRGMVTISGDGLTHEIINGLLTRSDADEVASRVTIGGLQGGSGNALVGSILYESKEPITLQAAAYQIIKGKIHNMDLALMSTRKIPVFYSFLSLAWAFIADVDLNSEHLRCFAGLRFDIMGAFRAAFQKKHRGILSFTEETIDTLPDIDGPINFQQGGWEQEEMQSFKHLLIMNTPMITTSDLNAPNCRIGDGSLDLQYLSSSKSWWQMVNFIFNFQSGSHFNKKTGLPAKGQDFTYKKIKAFRLEAVDSKGLGLMSIDGERYDSDIVQGIVLPGKLRVFSM